MKNLFTILTVVLLVSFGYAGVAQKSKQMNFKERLSAKKNQRVDKNKAKILKETMLTKGLISRPGNSEDYSWYETDWEHLTNTEYSYNTNGFSTEELATDAIIGDNISKTTWTWDSHDNLTEFTDYFWNGSDWEIIWGIKSTYTYDVNGNITEEINQSWDAGNWVYISKTNNEYNEDGYLIEEIGQDWENNAWVYDWKDEYIVGSQGEYIELIYYYWENNDWASDERYFDIVWHNWDKFQVQSYTSQIWEGEWVNDERFNATYTGDNYIGIYEEYDNTWVYYERETYTQSPTEQVYLWEDYENKGWVNSSRDSQFYDDHGNYTGYRYEVWENEEWVISWEMSYLYTYNENNDILEMVMMNWNWETQTLENSMRYVYSNFQYFQSDVETINSLSEIKIYPNPVEEMLNIDIRNENLTESVVQILNITGQKVYEGSLSGQHTTININILTNGIYILRIQTNDNKILNYKILKD
ncbi:MAG: T9SS type A sorting domain-containing protein [Bacteroidales bacterium]|nr:T9SS type A sorting domain-containing protein [Bacteroidales bacterium]